MMQTKRIEDLSKGDKIALDAGTGTITRVERCRIVESLGDVCYEVEWNDDDGNAGRALQGGKDEVQLATQAS